GVRGTAQTMVRYYEIRPLVDDTIPFADVEARSDGTYFFEGRQVVCNTTEFCVRFLSGEKQGAAMLTQDVRSEEHTSELQSREMSPLPTRRSSDLGVRGTAQTMVRYYEISPLVDDTIPFADVEARSDGTYFFEGRQVVCNTTEFCVRFLSGEKQGAAMLTQDV